MTLLILSALWLAGTISASILFGPFALTDPRLYCEVCIGWPVYAVRYVLLRRRVPWV